MQFGKVSVDGLNVFYRECGNADKPVMVLFHGFPSASHMFRDLMPMLEKDFHLIAPDYPGFGQSDSPARDEFDYTFDHLAEVMDGFLDAVHVDRFYMYVFDYGAPIGFRIAVKHPERILGIVSQNGNVYEEGLGPKWAIRAEYWKNPTSELREQYKSAFAKDTVYGQYTFGTQEGSVSPDGYSLDLYYAATIPDYAEKQSDLIYDYQNNVKLYPVFQEYLRTCQPKLLVIWGKDDPSFIWPGAEAFRKDLPDARIVPVSSGHFALENCCREIAAEILACFSNRKMREMRRQDRRLASEEILEILNNGEYGVLATATDEGKPYSIPLSYAFDKECHVIYMHCSADGGQKIDNLRLHPDVCFTVVGQTELMPEKYATKYWSANVFGTVAIIEEGPEKRKGIEAILRKYSPQHVEKGLKYIEGAIHKIYVLRFEIWDAFPGMANSTAQTNYSKHDGKAVDVRSFKNCLWCHELRKKGTNPDGLYGVFPSY